MPVLVHGPQHFKSYLSNKFHWPETVCDRGKINLAGHAVQRLSGNYFDQVLYSVFNERMKGANAAMTLLEK